MEIGFFSKLIPTERKFANHLDFLLWLYHNREVELLQAITEANFPYFIRLYHAFETKRYDSTKYFHFIMELGQGGSLKTAVAEADRNKTHLDERTQVCPLVFSHPTKSRP